MRLTVILFIVLSFTLSAIKPAAAGQDVLTVAAASDLSFALNEISGLFEEDTGVKVVVSLGSSGLLTRQIQAGAPFDLFFAANLRFIEELISGGHIIPDSVELYARGRIVLAVNKSSGLRAGDLEDLLAPEIKRVAIANPAHAPYGTAAMEALKGTGVWDGIKDKLVYGENVRQALQFIQTGNAPAGIVALSVAEVPEVTYTPIDPALHNPIDQAVAVVSTTKKEGLAREFIEFVNGEKGRPVMKRFGFMPPGGESF